MSKISTIYVCSHCEAQAFKWSGRCLECGKWGTMQTQTIEKKNEESSKNKIPPAEIIDFSNFQNTQVKKIKTNIAEIDRVFGGGIVPGSMTILSGEPGIGKSTIISQIARSIGDEPIIFYVSGEESAEQVKLRMDRLKMKSNNVKFLNDTLVEKIIAAALPLNPELIIIDSIQTIYTNSVENEAGSVPQIRASTIKLLELAKEKNIAVMLIGHITKDGNIAGPKYLEHIVDTVIYLEAEKNSDYRILRAIKNRFGSINELGIFEMTNEGFKEILNPSLIFLESSKEDLPGATISCFSEGSRQFLVEIQALSTKTVFGYPQRKSSGVDANRLAVLSAVITKRANVNLTNQDIILNIVGGIKIQDTATDLAICAAIVSSLLNQAVSKKTIILGEVGLGGEVRRVKNLEQRLKEAEKLGFEQALVPHCNIKNNGINLVKIKNLKELVNYLTNPRQIP